MPVGMEFAVTVGTLGVFCFLPGTALTYLLFPGPKLDLFERVPIGFALMMSLLVPPIVLARVLSWGWVQLLWEWIALSVFLVGAAVVVLRWRGSAQSSSSRLARYVRRIFPGASSLEEPAPHRPTPKILIAIFIALLIFIGLLTQIGPNDEDDWDYLGVVRGFADAASFPGLVLSDRDVANSWWFLHASIVRLFDVDVVRLGQNWMPLLFAPMAFLAFYVLARALFLSQTFALLAIFLQFAFYMSDLFYADTVVIWNGWWILAHMDQGHTIVISVLLPVFAAIIVRYLRQGDAILLAVAPVIQLGMIAIHGILGILMPALTVIAILVVRALFVREKQEWKKMGWLMIVMGTFMALFSPAVLSFVLSRQVVSGALPQILPTDLDFPLSRYRYTFFSPTLFTMKLEYLGHPPILAAILLIPCLLRFSRRDLTAQFLFGNILTLLLILYVPFLMAVFDRWITTAVERLWHWILDAFIIAYFLPYFCKILRDGWLAWRQRLWNRQVLGAVGLVMVCVVWLALWPMYLLNEWPKPLGPGHALPNGAYEMLRALRDHTAPGESAVVLAWRDITDAVPAYRATLRPVLYRENPRSRQRADADRFFDSVMATTVHLEILTRYQVNYLILSGDREITSQYDLLPEYFQLLYRNEYGTLYRVAASLEPNAVVEANTTTNYGEWAGAIQAYNAILAAEPDNSLAYTGLGIILHLLDKPKAAVRELEAAVRAAPANAQAHYRLVLLYRQMGLEVQAAEHIQSAGRLMENIQRAP